tara:strand:- start:289 stop:1437 length:1149 start_codon:yes stop_codon:yes gene_type:complete
MNNLYFDTAATTPIDKNVSDIMIETQNSIFGNPSSIHQFGQKSRSLIEKSRRTIATSFNCKPNEIIFTSGGTESNNLVLKGILKPGDHLITSSYEHPAVINAAQQLENNHIEVSYVKPDSNGVVSPETVQNEIKSNTRLISIMYVNNEIGSTNPIKDIICIAKKFNIKFHSDAVQIIGKQSLDFNALGADFLSIAAHKYYGPKGVGILFLKSGNSIESIINGGGQEQSVRPGTENVAGIAGMALATEVATNNIEQNSKKIMQLENLFLDLLDKTEIQYKINGQSRIPGIINMTFKNMLGQTLVMKLDMMGVAVSFGSACASGTLKPSRALLDIGMSEDDALKTIRISIGKFHQEDDIEILVQSLESILNQKTNVNHESNYVS